MRIKPTTTFTWRTVPTTTYSTRDKLSYLLQETFDKLLLEDWWWILLEESVYNEWNTPRKWTLLQDLTWAYVTDLLGQSVDWLTGKDWNLINTQWT